MVRISDELRDAIVNKMCTGLSIREAARQLAVCHTSVRNVWRRYLDTGDTKDRPKSGRPNKMFKREQRILCQ